MKPAAPVTTIFNRAPPTPRACALAVFTPEPIVVEAAQDVAVGDQKAVTEKRARLPQRAACADRLVLFRNHDARAEVPLDHFGAVPGQKHDLEAGEGFDHVLQ